MKKPAIALLLLMLSSPALSASFPYSTAIYDQITEAPMGMKITSKAYVRFSKNTNDTLFAEWVTEESSFTGAKRKFNLNTGGTLYTLDLNTKRCTKTDIRGVTEMVNNPEDFAEGMKKQMGLTKAGPCEGAGLKGVKYTSSFGEMCFHKDVFLLWQKTMGSTTNISNIKFDVPLPKEKTQLPSDIKCSDGPDFSRGISGMSATGSTTAQGQGTMENQQQSPPANMEEAMKKAKEAMGNFGDLFK